MKTDDLIKAIAADAGQPSLAVRMAWRLALALGIVLAAAAFLAMIGPRPDFEAAAHTGRFLFKFVVTIALAVGSLAAIRALSRPGAALKPALWLLAAPALLLASVAFELASAPSGEWAGRMIGSNSLLCLTFVPLIGLGPLAVFLVALRYAAPTRPVLAGAVAGLLAGGVAATFYAAHCFDDSPLFVAVWYTLGVSILAVAGALLAPRVARW